MRPRWQSPKAGQFASSAPLPRRLNELVDLFLRKPVRANPAGVSIVQDDGVHADARPPFRRDRSVNERSADFGRCIHRAVRHADFARHRSVDDDRRRRHSAAAALSGSWKYTPLAFLYQELVVELPSGCRKRRKFVDPAFGTGYRSCRASAIPSRKPVQVLRMAHPPVPHHILPSLSSPRQGFSYCAAIATRAPPASASRGQPMPLLPRLHRYFSFESLHADLRSLLELTESCSRRWARRSGAFWISIFR